MPLSPGTYLGPYEVIAPIGAGSMGEVYRARDARLKRDVAIKILPSNDPDRLRRFEQEAQAAGSLNDPNILAIYDVGTSEGIPFIVSELLSGETLRAHLAGTPVPMPKALDLAHQIARGLSAAHANGIVHRDLKPENLFVTRNGRIKILDFGLAKLTDLERPLNAPQSDVPTMAAGTEIGMVLGTAGYMSPEQVRGDAADARSDIFSVGAVLYELLGGRRAFGGASPVEAMSAILRDEPPDLIVSNAPAPPALDRLVRRCLAKRPEDRYQSARDLELALADVVTDLSVTPAAGALHDRRSRSLLWITVGAMAAASVLAVIALAPGIARRASPADAPAPSAAPAPIRSLVVLPLVNYSKDPEQEYFSDGMTEALIADLARVGGLRVISRTSAMTYKSAKKALPEIARELNVDAVVEGSVVRTGDTVRITAQLIEAKTDRPLWSNSYERSLRDVLSLQGDVAQAIAREIRITLTPREAARFAAARAVNPDAHEAYLRGRHALSKMTEPDIRKAMDYFSHAIGKDPGYAPPYAGLADAYSLLRFSYAAPHAVMPQSKAAAAKAIELDPALAEGHVSMAVVHMTYEFDWTAAERELNQAIGLSPNLADAHMNYALFLGGLGRPNEARSEIELAQKLDPLSPWIMSTAGWIHYLARQYDRSLEANLRALELDPNFWPAHRDLGLAYEKVGRFADAVASLQKARALDANSSVLEMLAGAYAAWGKKVEARQVLADLNKMAGQHYVCPYEVATVHAGLGDEKAALEWLEKGYKERADCMAWTGADPKLDGLHGDPQFEDLLRRMRISR
jgi:eukaryotic-like serine/threonine-protein kinase